MSGVAVAAIAVLIGALVRGYAGFGASMFWVASLSLIYAPASVVPTVLALEVIASLALVPAVFRQVQWRSLGWMLGATVLTMPAGVAMLSLLPEREMRLVVAVAIFTGAAALALGVRSEGEPGVKMAVAAGSVSGVVNGSTGVGGPPAVLLYFSGATAHHVGRASLIAYFLGTDLIGFAMMASVGLVDQQVLMHTAGFAPLALGGIAIGQKLFARSGERGFRKVVLVVLLVMSLAMVLQVLLPG
jgi:uncharacterized membrane protein YfcA